MGRSWSSTAASGKRHVFRSRLELQPPSACLPRTCTWLHAGKAADWRRLLARANYFWAGNVATVAGKLPLSMYASSFPSFEFQKGFSPFLCSLPKDTSEGSRDRWKFDFRSGQRGQRILWQRAKKVLNLKNFGGGMRLSVLSLVIRRWKGRPGNRDFENEKCKLNLWVWWVVRIGRRGGTNRF